MTYEPLHHKYRPQTFAALVGQEAIATTLSNALRQQRIAPAYLFTGARGTGKTSSARIFAKSLNCLAEKVPTDQPCGTCEVCRAIANGAALDVIEIDAASNTGVDNIRELIERAQFAPVQCRYKVYIIDEVHMLSTAAFNALLKTLEEPPERVVFVLATTDPQRVLPTIISRCQRFNFQRIPLEAMAQHLTLIAANESIPIEPEAIQLIAQLSQGGLRDAESLLDQLSLLDGNITIERVWELVGAVPERDLMALVTAIAQDQPDAVLDWARHLMDRGREPLVVLQNLTSFYRDLQIAKTAPNRSDLVAITPATWAEMCQFVEAVSLSVVQQGQRVLQDNESRLRHTTQPRLWLEVTLLSLLPSAMAATVTPAAAPPDRGRSPRAAQPASSGTLPLASSSATGAPSAPPPLPTPAEPPATIQSPIVAETAPASPVAPPPEPPPASHSPSQPATPPPVSPQPVVAEPSPSPEPSIDLAAFWEQVLALVQPNSTQILLRQQCRLLSFDRDVARIGVKTPQLLKMAKSKQSNIEAAFAHYCDRPVRVNLETAPQGEAEAVSTAAVSYVPKPMPAPSPRPQPEAAAAPPPVTPHSPQRSQPIEPPASPREVPHSAPEPAGASDVPPPVAPVASWDVEDEVRRAARSLAQMFNGQIVSFDEALPGSDGAAIATNLEATDASSDLDDDDVPF